MDLGLMRHYEAECGASLGGVIEPTVTGRLEAQRDNLKEHLARVEEAIAALKANPEVERVINLVSRV